MTESAESEHVGDYLRRLVDGHDGPVITLHTADVKALLDCWQRRDETTVPYDHAVQVARDALWVLWHDDAAEPLIRADCENGAKAVVAALNESGLLSLSLDPEDELRSLRSAVWRMVAEVEEANEGNLVTTEGGDIIRLLDFEAAAVRRALEANEAR